MDSVVSLWLHTISLCWDHTSRIFDSQTGLSTELENINVVESSWVSHSNPDFTWDIKHVNTDHMLTFQIARLQRKICWSAPVWTSHFHKSECINRHSGAKLRLCCLHWHSQDHIGKWKFRPTSSQAENSIPNATVLRAGACKRWLGHEGSVGLLQNKFSSLCFLPLSLLPLGGTARRSSPDENPLSTALPASRPVRSRSALCELPNLGHFVTPT